MPYWKQRNTIAGPVTCGPQLTVRGLSANAAAGEGRDSLRLGSEYLP